MSETLTLISAGGVVVRRVDGVWEALVLHRIRPDEWRLPKGKTHLGETLEQTALREVTEESGLYPDILAYICATSYRYEARREGLVDKTVHYFLMTVSATAPLHLEARNFDTANWLPLDQAIAQLTFDSERQALRESARKLAEVAPA